MNLRILNYGLRIIKALIIVFLLLTIDPSHITVSASEWGGVDESVVEKYAEEHGRSPRDPLINTDQGDLLLFVFLIAGAVGGFIGGYYWRVLTEKNGKTGVQYGSGQSRS